MLCQPLFGYNVKVYLHHAARGLSINCVHALQHRRYIGHEDNQYLGIQGDMERWYMVYTRASRRTTVWLEWQPFGTPSWPCSEGRKEAKGRGGQGRGGGRGRVRLQEASPHAPQPSVAF